MNELNLGGRPYKLNKLVVAAIELGGFSLMTINETCIHANISYRSYLNYRRQAKEAMNEDGYIEDDLLREFFTAHEQGMIKRKDMLMAVCLDDAKSNPDMALKILERKFTDFSNKIKQEVEVKAEPVVYDFDGMPFEEVEKLVLNGWKLDEEEKENE